MLTIRHLSIYLLMMAFHGLLAQGINLKVEVKGLKLIEGSQVRIAVYDSEDDYFDEEKMFSSAEKEVDSESMIFLFKDFPPGNYALTLYHDEDGDGEMDRRWYGPPKEGYAFSNNFTSSTRPARFDDAVFELTSDTTVSVTMVY
ncbi:MAG: DUF2141 domain-containing protein [bacterium]